MSKIDTEPRFILVTAIIIVAFIVIAVVNSNTCQSVKCWGSKAQMKTFTDNPKIIEKIKQTDKHWAFSNSFAKARIFDKRNKNKWFADWWKENHWDYTLFTKYSSKAECYAAAYRTVYDRAYSRAEPFEQAIPQIDAESPVRCFPAGTPVSERWKYKPPKSLF